MATNNGDKRNDVRRRRVRWGGVIEEWDAALGRVLTLPADPRSRKIDVSAGAAGWERWQTFLRRLRR